MIITSCRCRAGCRYDRVVEQKVTTIRTKGNECGHRYDTQVPGMLPAIVRSSGALHPTSQTTTAIEAGVCPD